MDDMDESGYVNGYIERTSGGAYTGRITIDGILLSNIVGQYFKQGTENYLWLRRRKILEYDDTTRTYKERDARPFWEVYLKKQVDDGIVAYKGEFKFLHFNYSIEGVWDKVLGQDKQRRLNLLVERLPMPRQTIINAIRERNLNDGIQDGKQ